MKRSKEALVIVHLSSLDAYTEEIGSWTGGDLAEAIAAAIKFHEGPVYIVDQGWEDEGKPSEPRMWLLDEIEKRSQSLPPIVWIHFDEAEQPWPPFLWRLRRRLERDGVSRVVIGGLWYDDTGKTGCVTHVHRYLAKYFDARVSGSIVGTLDDEPGGWDVEDDEYEDDDDDESEGG